MASRRRAEEMIASGRVTVDGRPAAIGQKVDPETVRIEIDGAPLPVRPGLVYYLINKPAGVVSTTTDPQGRPVVTGLVPAEPRVHPVGRLDRDTTGLLILTNDGELTQLLTHPRHGVEKRYLAVVAGHPGRKALRHLRDGVELDDGPARAARARVVDRLDDRSLVEIVMTEGRKREVRRMCAAIGHPVRELARTGIGPIRDDSLKPGEWRHLRPAEVMELYLTQ